MRLTWLGRFLGMLVVVLCVGGVIELRAQAGRTGDMVGFSQAVDSLCQSPPSSDSLEIKRTKLIDERYITFIGMKGSPESFIVVVTLEPFKDPKQLSLSVRFKGLRPDPGKVTTWGYMFDRNRDGKIDYMALLGGAAPFERDDMPEDYPPSGVTLSPAQIELFVSHCRLIFNSWADENFDGKLDGAIHIDMDPVRDWVQRQLVIRSSKFNGKFDEVWAFREYVTNRQDSVVHEKNSVPYRPVNGKPSAITPAVFKQQNDILSLINRAIAVSGMKAENLLHHGYYR